MPDEVRSRLMERGTESDSALVQATARIIAQVRVEGDTALRKFAERYDGVTLESLDVPPQACTDALDRLAPAVRRALEEAADAIALFHRAQIPAPISAETTPGVRIRREAQPLGRVGVYVPGGRAAYPSSVLMGVVPARIAGVNEIVVCSPPGPDGRPAATVLAACAIAGADRVFAIGGAGAVAALAFGTASVPRVDRIIGPGNAWVAEAKRQVNGVVGIDCPAGPSEILIIADASGEPELIAAELIAQTEHDPDATAVLVTTHTGHLDSVRAQLGNLMRAHPRRPIIAASLEIHGAIVAVQDIETACRFASDHAPEHLLVLTRDAESVAARVRNAGTIFVGPGSSVTFGDYVTGANHVLPTGGTARAFAGLSTHDFLRWVTIQEVTADGAATLAPRAATLADAEGLPGHAAAARLRSGAGLYVEHMPARPLRFRSDYADLRTYDPGRLPTEIDLSDNTNLWGSGDAVKEALAAIDASVITRYPAVYADRLRNALAESVGVKRENIATGCGSDDVIDSTMRAFAAPGDRVAFPWPTFGMVASFARMNGLTPIPVPLRSDLELDVEAILAARAEITYVCRPNNPTGTLFQRDDVAAIVARAHGLVVIDEAYIDFAGDNLAALVIDSGRAVALRTFSKVYGLAGLRVGFAIGPAPVIAEIEKSRGPYKVSGLAEAAALAALAAGRSEVERTIAFTIENRSKLVDALEAAGHAVLPSAANFVLMRLPEGFQAQSVATSLQRSGVAVRPFADLLGPAVIRSTKKPAPEPSPIPAVDLSGDWLRVTVGPWPMMERFLDAFRAVIGATT
jgi:histidinol dehydrogenase